MSTLASGETRRAGATAGNYDKPANDRKRHLYWIGFLQGALASKRIEDGELDALQTEADAFAAFFKDPDASDLAQDLRARCFSGQNDMMTALEDIVEDKRAELLAEKPWAERDEINEFLGFCAGVVCDGIVLQSEAEAMLDRFHSSMILPGSVVFRDLWRELEATLADGVLDKEEAEALRTKIALLVGDGHADTGLPNIGNVAELDEPIRDAAEVRISGSCFVLTGPMALGKRDDIIADIERCGGTVAKAASRKVDYVVVSSEASRCWRTTHFGTKIEKAKELIVKGHKLRFVAETALGGALAAQGDGKAPAPAHKPGRLAARAAAGAPAGAPAPERLRFDFAAAQSFEAMASGAYRFIALDVETANRDRGSICQIGLAGVHEDGAMTTWTTYVDPQAEFDDFNINFHGIGPEHVIGAPLIGELLSRFHPLLSRGRIIQHSSFDRSAVRRACLGLRRAEPEWIWGDSVRIARRAWPEFIGAGGHGLAHLKEKLGLQFNHHDAGEDARAAAEVVLMAEARTGIAFEELLA